MPEEEKQRHSRYERDLTEGHVVKQLIVFALPFLASNLIQSLYSVADMLIVGNFAGNISMSGVNIGSQITFILTNIVVGLCTGGTILIAQAMGRRDRKAIEEVTATLMTTLLIAGVIITALMIFLRVPILRLIQTPEEAFDEANRYLVVTCTGILFIFAYNVLSAVQRGMGDSKRPLYFLIGSCMVNILLDLILVAGLRLGVAGAAIATISSQFFSACMVVYALTHTEDMYKLVWSKVRIDGRMLQRIVRIGIPAGMQSVMYNISNIIIQSGVNTLGTDNVTSWATYGKVDGLYWMMINALGISVTTFVGQNYGAGRMDRVHKGAGACMIIGTIMTAIVSTLLYLKGYLLIDLFTSDAQVQEIGLSLIHFLVPTLITYITIEILSGTLRGVGDAWMPLIMTGIGVCCLRVIWIIFFLPQYRSILAAAFCYPLSWTITSIAFVIYYFFFSSLRRVDGRKWFQKKDY